jgi:hypothetical protein
MRREHATAQGMRIANMMTTVNFTDRWLSSRTALWISSWLPGSGPIKTIYATHSGLSCNVVKSSDLMWEGSIACLITRLTEVRTRQGTFSFLGLFYSHANYLADCESDKGQSPLKSHNWLCSRHFTIPSLTLLHLSAGSPVDLCRLFHLCVLGTSGSLILSLFLL